MFDPEQHREEQGWFDALELAPAPPARRTSTAMAR